MLKPRKASKVMQAISSLAPNGVEGDDKGAALKRGDPNWWASFLHRLDSWAFSLNKTVVVKADLHSGNADISSCQAS